MSKERRFVEFLESLDYKPRAYSGRGMMGRECVGIVVPSAVIAAWRIAAELIGVDSAYVILNPRWDSMGRDEILYWPSVEWPADET